MKTKGYILAAVSAISYGLIPLFIIPVKSANLSLDTTLFYRFFISALFIFAYLLYKNESLKINATELLTMVILGLFYALSSEFLFLGYDYLTPGIASTILFVYPVIVAIIMTAVFKEKINRLTIISLFITMCGILILSTNESVFNINFWGLSIALLSAVFYALYIVIVNKTKITFSGFKITFYSLLFSSLYYLTKAFITDDTLEINSIDTLFNFFLFALVTTVLSISALVYAIKIIGSTPTSIMGALEPVVAVAVSVLLFYESFTLSLFVGVSLIIAGVIINIIAENKDEKIENKKRKQLSGTNIKKNPST